MNATTTFVVITIVLRVHHAGKITTHGQTVPLNLFVPGEILIQDKKDSIVEEFNLTTAGLRVRALTN